MTEAIDFNQLKNAFTRNVRHAAVRSLSSQQPSQPTQPVSPTLQFELAEMSAELRRAKTELVNTQQKLAVTISEHEKSLRYIRTLSEEKMASDTTFARFHEAKMRMHQTLSKKTTEIEQLRKHINAGNILQSKLKTTIAQKQKSLEKAIEGQRTLTDQLTTALTLNDKLMGEIKTLKQQQQPAYRLQRWAVDQANTMLAYIKGKTKSVLTSAKKETTALTWIPANKALPKRQCLVFVRNESESDIAVYYPQTRSFKCAKKNIRVKEWALSR